MQLKCKEDLSTITETFKEDKMTDTLFLEPAKIDTSIQTYNHTIFMFYFLIQYLYPSHL